MTTDMHHHPEAQTQEQDLANEESATWLFGYGSLIWKPELPFVDAQPARIDGYLRRFWQGSEDHRGTPEAPGRVVTLVPDRQGRCDGVAYLMNNVDIEQTFAQLDHREKKRLHPADSEFKARIGNDFRKPRDSPRHYLYRQ